MKKYIERLFFNLIGICIVFTIFKTNVYGVSASSSATSLYVGDTCTITINGSSYAGRYDITNSNSSIVSISATSLFIDDKQDTITVKALAVGSSSIVITPTDVASLDDPEKKDTTSRTITITVKEKEEVKEPENESTTNTNNTTNNNTTTVQKSTNNYLKKLQVNIEGLTPNFSKSKLNYSLVVDSSVESINVTANAEHSNAKVFISGNTGLKTGDNNVYITVTAESGDKRTYTILVTKTADPNLSNSYLENLIVENANLTPVFSKDVFEYDCGTVSSDVSNLKILTFPEIEEAKVEVFGNDELNYGENSVVVNITSKDGTTSKEYKIKVIRKEPEVVETNAVVSQEANNSSTNLEQEEKLKTKLVNLSEAIKDNALLVLMYIFIVVEFFEILYLYCKLNNYHFFKKKQTINSDEVHEEIEKELKEKLNEKVFEEEVNIEESNEDDNTNDSNVLNVSKSRRGKIGN